MAKKSVSILDKSACASKQAEHDVVFDWCVKSAQQMLDVMTLRHKKSFVRKISDEVQGAKLLGDL